MSTEQNDNTITPSTSRWSGVSTWFFDRWSEGRILSKTLITLAFIVNSVALGLFALDLVEPSAQTASIMGAISLTFATVVLGTFVHQGVKFQSTNKRKR